MFSRGEVTGPEQSVINMKQSVEARASWAACTVRARRPESRLRFLSKEQNFRNGDSSARAHHLHRNQGPDKEEVEPRDRMGIQPQENSTLLRTTWAC